MKYPIHDYSIAFIDKLPSHVGRLIVECLDLHSKLDKLSAFINDASEKAIFPTLSRQDKRLLIEQSVVMKKYADILEIRIDIAMDKHLQVS